MSRTTRSFVVGTTLAVTCVVLQVGAARAADQRFLDYLYMEANEGGSSAGHVALAFAERTYAFQRSREGRLVLDRDATTDARFRYAVLGNRAVHRTRVAVSADTFERLREGFNQRYLIQQSQLALLGRLENEQHLLAALVARLRGDGARADPANPDGLAIDAAGYFGTGTSAALAALRDAIVAAEGAGFLARRRAELRAELAALVPDASVPAAPGLAVDRYPDDSARFGERYTATLSGIAALETLQRAPGLDPDGLVTVPDPLDGDEVAALGRRAARLRVDLVRLAGSARRDFGFPLLVGMARLAALERSVATGRLVVLDAFPPNGRRLAHAALARTPEAARGLRDDACALLATSRRHFVAAADPNESELVDLENDANRCVELARGIAEERDARVSGETLVPVRPALRTDLVVPQVSRARLEAAERRAAEATRAYVQALDDLYRYDLIRRNCATEMFRTVDAVLGPDADAALGGRVDPDGGGRFIPRLAARAVRRTWRVAASDTTPSYRRAEVAALASAGNPFTVRLRESNVLTSTVYQGSHDDSTFLFFTDDVFLLRPLLGTANLVVGVGASLVGVGQSPFDRGAALRAGLRGVLWSVPELFFVNVRKGSFDWVERRALPTAPRPPESPPPSP